MPFAFPFLPLLSLVTNLIGRLCISGGVMKVTLPDTRWVGYNYDAHRKVAVYDNKGDRTESQLDNAGNRTGETTRTRAAI